MLSELKQPLVLIPGWGADQQCWAPLEAYLGDLFDVRCLELPTFDGRELGTWFDALHELGKHVPQGAIVIGWSLGGMFGVKLAEVFPEKVERLILVGTNACFVATELWPWGMPEREFDDFSRLFASQPLLAQKRFNRLQALGDSGFKALTRWLDETSVLREDNHSQSLGLLNYLKQLNNVSSLRELHQPCLAVFGDQDALVPVAAAAAIEALNPNIHTARIRQCGHVPHFSHTGELAALIVDFCWRKSERYLRAKSRVQASFSKASVTYDHYADFQLRVANTLLKWVPDLNGKVLDLGCGTGYCLQAMEKKPAVTYRLGLDISAGMLDQAQLKFQKSDAAPRWCIADFESLPFSPGSFDYIVSSLAVQWCDALCSTLCELRRVLSPGGKLVLSSLGPETLQELAQAWHDADPNHVHVNEFSSADRLLLAARIAGFHVECFSVDYCRLEFSSVVELMRSIKGIGAHNVNEGGNPGLTGRTALARLENAYALQRLGNGKLPATYQVFYCVLSV